MSRFLYNEKSESAVCLCRVKVGKGLIYFNQFAPFKNRQRFDRVNNRLIANLGKSFSGSILDGEQVPVTEKKSLGYPQKISVFNSECDHKLRTTFIESTYPTMERMMTSQILTIPGWHEVTSEIGIWDAEDLKASEEVYLYDRILSQSARKNQKTNLGIPNPEALTFMDVYGEGTVEVTVNGYTFEPVNVKGMVSISDIELEKGCNHVLVR